MFLGLGALLITLALTGNALSAPAFQKAFGRWLTAWATDITTAVPAGLAWVLVVGLAVGVAYLAVRSLRPEQPAPDTPTASQAPPAGCCGSDQSEPEGSALEGVNH
jgi:hypothetical protein